MKVIGKTAALAAPSNGALQWTKIASRFWPLMTKLGRETRGQTVITTLKLQAGFGSFDEDEDPGIWYRLIEIDLKTSLEDLHHCIQGAVGFDNDHLYEFFIANSTISRDRIRFCDENRGLWDHAVVDLFPLPKHKKLFYLFDYGDSWYFKVTKSRKRATIREPGIVYPRVTEIVGANPEQYPDCDY